MANLCNASHRLNLNQNLAIVAAATDCFSTQKTKQESPAAIDVMALTVVTAIVVVIVVIVRVNCVVRVACVISVCSC